ncbi:hypothetical protein [Haloechinothrix salitolerans]|uniref:Uncharacterized protein n=1 Tax=Haloechinothrix salitolerans TaxID=926830 RepID=A0ABW2C8M8_9PSEU
MQRLDGIALAYLQAVNAQAELPDISFILSADPATVCARLTQRGAHNRYQHRPGSIAEELRCYDESRPTSNSWAGPSCASTQPTSPRNASPRPHSITSSNVFRTALWRHYDPYRPIRRAQRHLPHRWRQARAPHRLPSCV